MIYIRVGMIVSDFHLIAVYVGKLLQQESHLWSTIFGLWKPYNIFPNTKSEIVLPVFNKFKNLIAVPHIDSDLQDAFDNDDTAGLLLIIDSKFLRNLL